MVYAIKINDIITNTIVASPHQIDEFQKALNCEFIDPSEYGLAIGDYWNGTHWTRNVNGEQVILEPVPYKVTIEDRVLSLEGDTAALEDALCEIDATNSAAIAVIEDALCELDK